MTKEELEKQASKVGTGMAEWIKAHAAEARSTAALQGAYTEACRALKCTELERAISFGGVHLELRPGEVPTVRYRDKFDFSVL